MVTYIYIYIHVYRIHSPYSCHQIAMSLLPSIRRSAVRSMEGKVVSLESQPPHKPENWDVYFQKWRFGSKEFPFQWGDFQENHHQQFFTTWVVGSTGSSVVEEESSPVNSMLLLSYKLALVLNCLSFFVEHFCTPPEVEQFAPEKWWEKEDYPPFLLGPGNFWHLRGELLNFRRVSWL